MGYGAGLRWATVGYGGLRGWLQSAVPSPLCPRVAGIGMGRGLGWRLGSGAGLLLDYRETNLHPSSAFWEQGAEARQSRANSSSRSSRRVLRARFGRRARSVLARAPSSASRALPAPLLAPTCVHRRLRTKKPSCPCRLLLPVAHHDMAPFCWTFLFADLRKTLCTPLFVRTNAFPWPCEYKPPTQRSNRNIRTYVTPRICG